ncbi:MAG: LysM domain-containing protein [Tissierellaceae bacterium]|nr:LysM domain-containing protein [Tissierellaceae bacterium]
MESKAKKIKTKTRPLTKNEKFLLTALGLVLMFWATFRFVYEPQAAKMDELKLEKELYDAQIVEHNRILKNEEKIKEELEILTVERDQILSNYFPALDQAQILYLLNDLMADDRVDVDDMSFTRPGTETKGEMDIHKMDINIPLSGKYDGVYDIVEAINNSPRRIVINSLNLNNDTEGTLAGNINLKIYSLEGLAKTDKDVIYVDVAEDGDTKAPFSPYSGFVQPTNGSGVTDGDTGEYSAETPIIDGEVINNSGTVLHEFDNRMYEFIPSSPRVKGNTIQSTIKKSGRYSMRLEYDILALEDDNRAYVNLLGDDIIIKYPPNSIGMWVYSYGYSPGTLGLQFRDQTGENYEFSFTDGISWMGWSYVKVSPPQDLKLYPLTLERLYFEIPYGREDYGVLLMDRLEAYYPNSTGSEDTDRIVNEYYVVQEGDTISDISRKVYGTLEYKNEIMQLNEIKPGEVLTVGKVLVLRRH